MLQNLTSLSELSAKGHAILRVGAASSLSVESVVFDNNWVADIQSYPDDSQSNAITIQDLEGNLSFSSVSFINNYGSSGGKIAPIESSGFYSGLIVF